MAVHMTAADDALGPLEVANFVMYFSKQGVLYGTGIELCQLLRNFLLIFNQGPVVQN